MKEEQELKEDPVERLTVRRNSVLYLSFNTLSEILCFREK